MWKKTLRSAKKTHTIQRMEAASDEVWSMDEINALLDNAAVWSSMDQTIRRAKRDGHVRKKLNLNRSHSRYTMFFR